MSSHLNKVLARLAGGAKCCNAVVDLAAWAALRIDVPLVIQQRTEAPPRFIPMGDFNGAIWLGPSGAMLNDLAIEDRLRHARRCTADEQRLLAARRHAQALMDAPVEGSLTSGGPASETDSVLVVRSAPRRGRAGGRPSLEPGLDCELRTTKCPMLLAPSVSLSPPELVVIAFDGSIGACDRIERLRGHALLTGLPVLLAMAGAISPMATERLHQARQMLQAGRFSVESTRLQGPPALAIPALLSAQRPALLVMGAFGGSRLRRWVSGSTTASLLLASPVPVLIQR
ncbi:MAG: universal stress protein [Burkholderiaceae bacterium]|nr:universal stress protein [Burkholderiaceae bacterium]